MAKQATHNTYRIPEGYRLIPEEMYELALEALGHKDKESPGCEWTLRLMLPGQKIIQTIKLVRELTGLGLKEAKALVEDTPTDVRVYDSLEKAKQAREALNAVGATAEIA